MIARKRTSRRKGNSVLEAVFVFPILLVLTLNAVDFGYFFYVKHTLQGAAREGARAAAVPDNTNTHVTTAVTQAMNAAGIPSSKYTIAVRNATDTANVTVASQPAGTAILVKVTANWGDVRLRPTPPFVIVLGDAKPCTGQTTMRKEG